MCWRFGALYIPRRATAALCRRYREQTTCLHGRTARSGRCKRRFPRVALSVSCHRIHLAHTVSTLSRCLRVQASSRSVLSQARKPTRHVESMQRGARPGALGHRSCTVNTQKTRDLRIIPYSKSNSGCVLEIAPGLVLRSFKSARKCTIDDALLPLSPEGKPCSVVDEIVYTLPSPTLEVFECINSCPVMAIGGSISMSIHWQNPGRKTTSFDDEPCSKSVKYR